MGGKTAVNFALTWPEKLYGLLVADISPFVSEYGNPVAYAHHKNILGSILSIDFKSARTREVVEKLLSRTIDSDITRGFILKNLKRESDNSFSWKLNASALLENLGRIMEGIEPGDDYSEELSGFPVFFLKGEYSDYLPESDFPKIRRIFPAADFIIIPGSGHWIHADNPEAVKECLLRFLDNR